MNDTVVVLAALLIATGVGLAAWVGSILYMLFVS